MIDLFLVKQYGEYDFVQDSLPTGDGTWLCSLTDSGYTRGYSYQVESGSATRIEQTTDIKIEASIFPTIKNVCDWLNNPFYARRALQDTQKYSWSWYGNAFRHIELSRKWSRYHSDASSVAFLDGVLTGVDDTKFEIGDLVNIEGALRNNVYAYVTSKSSGSITLNNPDLRNTTENVVIFLSDMPVSVERVIANMINYDVYSRELSEMQSETIGNYSYTKADVGGLEYPTSLLGNLKSYRMAKLVS